MGDILPQINSSIKTRFKPLKIAELGLSFVALTTLFASIFRSKVVSEMGDSQLIPSMGMPDGVSDPGFEPP